MALTENGHRVEPVEGSAYSAEGSRNVGKPADPRFAGHYPAEALCRGCHGVIRVEWYAELGVAGWWRHTGRAAGEPS